MLTLHLGWQGPGRATPQTVPPLQDRPAPPAALRGAAQPLTPGRRWGAHSAPDGWAASCVGSRGAPRARGLCPAPSSPLCPGATKCTYPGAALPANRGGGSALLYPTASEGLHSRPPTAWGQLKGCLWRAARCHPPLPLLAPLHPARMPPPWQRCTPSSWALTPRETLRQMVLTPAPCPGCSPFAHGGPGAVGWGGLGSLPWDFS